MIRRLRWEKREKNNEGKGRKSFSCHLASDWEMIKYIFADCIYRQILLNQQKQDVMVKHRNRLG